MSPPAEVPDSLSLASSAEPDQVEYAFVDPDRHQKLVAALKGLDGWIEQRGRDLAVAGLVAGVVVDGALVKVSSYGFADVENSRAVDQDSVFRIGSITKPFTTMAVLQLRDAGRLALDAPAARYLPELAGVQPLTPDAAAITVRHLLMHTSGLPREGATLNDSGTGTSESALLEALAGMPLEFEPGSRYQYSNQGFSLLGSIVARVSELPYREYMATRLFRPLGLASAAWDASSVPGGRLALPYQRGASGSFELQEEPEQFGSREPGGGLYISARDFGRFLAWQLAAHPPGPASEAEVLRRSSRRESHHVGRLTGLSVTATAPDARWVASAHASTVGLSWHGYQTCAFDHVVFHNGLVHAYASDSALLPEHGVGVFAFTNTAPADVGSIRHELLERLRQSGALVPRVKRASRAPKLERALQRLLQVYNRWDAEKYDAMLSDWHKERITEEREQQELEEYRTLHGRCTVGEMLRYTSSRAARYLLSCEKARLEMELYLNPKSDLIDGFVGYSTGVVPSEAMQRAARRVMDRLSAKAPDQDAELFSPDFAGLPQVQSAAAGLSGLAPCQLGELVERDGNRWYRFRVRCKTGPDHVLHLHLDDEDSSKLDGFRLEAVRSGPCAER